MFSLRFYVDPIGKLFIFLGFPFVFLEWKYKMHLICVCSQNIENEQLHQLAYDYLTTQKDYQKLVKCNDGPVSEYIEQITSSHSITVSWKEIFFTIHFHNFNWIFRFFCIRLQKLHLMTSHFMCILSMKMLPKSKLSRYSHLLRNQWILNWMNTFCSKLLL